jgi:hypothetical protein
LYTNTSNREKVDQLPGAGTPTHFLRKKYHKFINYYKQNQFQFCLQLVGISVEFGLDRAAALQREEERICEIAASRQADEEQYRQDEMDRWERACQRVDESYVFQTKI